MYDYFVHRHELENGWAFDGVWRFAAGSEAGEVRFWDQDCWGDSIVARSDAVKGSLAPLTVDDLPGWAKS